jgi:hypothetical protein
MAMGSRTTGIRLAALGAVLALGLAACARQADAPSRPAAPAQAQLQRVTITAGDDWETTGLDSLKAGWVTITFDTLEGAGDHGLEVVRFKQDVSIEELLSTEDPDEFLAMAEPLGGFVGITGAESHTLTIRLDAGSYGMVDFGESEEGPNFLRGMTATFEVTEGDGTAGIQPASDGEIVMREFAIDLPEGFTGQGTYLVRNAGALIHELNIGRVPPGIDPIEELERHAETGRGRVTEVPGLAMIGPGREAYLELDLSDGSYAFACFFSGGPEGTHALKGMYTSLTVG